jgi:hypothetical protein
LPDYQPSPRAAPNRIHFRFRFRSRSYFDSAPGDPVPSIPLLTHLTALEGAEWLRTSLTTFATTVASILPGHFPAYARVYHPFGNGGDSAIGLSKWGVLAARAGWELSDPAAAEEFAYHGVSNAQARTGTLSPRIIDAIVEHLRPATTTPEQCYFAVWEGFAGSAVPPTLAPKLELPNRAYHVFVGPVEAALSSFDAVAFSHQSANLWWPADQAWCVATEIDFAWTYVGGPRPCIDAILADSRLDAVQTSARTRW